MELWEKKENCKGKQGYKKDQDESTAHMKWRELNVFLVFGYGRVHLVLRLRSSKAEPAKAESQFKLVRSDRKEQQEAQDTLKKNSPPALQRRILMERNEYAVSR